MWYAGVMAETPKKRPPVKKPAPAATVEGALRANLAKLHQAGDLNEKKSALTEVAIVLARTLDVGAGLATAAVARELRATLEAMIKETTTNDDTQFNDLLARLSTPIRN
jgi:hypothetical protein